MSMDVRVSCLCLFGLLCNYEIFEIYICVSGESCLSEIKWFMTTYTFDIILTGGRVMEELPKIVDFTSAQEYSPSTLLSLKSGESDVATKKKQRHHQQQL